MNSYSGENNCACKELCTNHDEGSQPTLQIQVHALGKAMWIKSTSLSADWEAPSTKHGFILHAGLAVSQEEFYA